MVELVTGYRGSTERGQSVRVGGVEPPLVTWFVLMVHKPLSKLAALNSEGRGTLVGIVGTVCRYQVKRKDYRLKTMWTKQRIVEDRDIL